ncbi:hypothetical protein [Pseudomonas aeruginosa]|uniref:hypothetical protein n=1 Tax=Pseudomonas aeruginosa TaxID=287 RepID=UPI00071C0498|nr:hypothetical protein [Pseudomonas aeruginosa]
MHQVIAAVKDAIATAAAQPTTIPELPAEWIKKARTALEQNSSIAIMDTAVELVEAHAGYRASWDHWPWLETLRDVTRKEVAFRSAKKILTYGETDRAVAFYVRFANATPEAAKAALGIG